MSNWNWFTAVGHCDRGSDHGAPRLVLGLLCLLALALLLWACGAESEAGRSGSDFSEEGSPGAREHTSSDISCDDLETAPPECVTARIRGAESCPGPALDPRGDGTLFCLPLPPLQPSAPRAIHPAFRSGPYPDEPCPELARGRCNREPPCASVGERFADEEAIRAFFDASETEVVGYVDPLAANDGDGTRERPWHRLEEHLDGLPDKAIIALASGTLHETLELGRSIRILGACDGPSVIRGSEGSEILITVNAADVELVSLTFAPQRHGLVAGQASDLLLQHVIFDRVEGRALSLEHGASVWMEDVHILARPGARRGNALFSHDARVQGRRLLIEGWWTAGVNAQASAEVELWDLAIDGGEEAASDMFALWASQQARMQVTRVDAIRAGSSFAVVDGRAAGAAPELVVRDLHLRSLATPGDSSGWRRHGFIVVGQGHLSLERARAEMMPALFLTLEDDARAEIRDVDVEGTEGFAAGRSFNVPFQLLDRSHLEASRVRVGAAEVYAFNLLHAASASIEDLRVEGVMPDADAVGPGRAITMGGTGALRLKGADIRFGGDNGLVLTGSTISLEDVRVQPAEVGLEGITQRGLIIQEAAEATLRRVHARGGSAGIALLEVSGSTSGEDIIVEEQLWRPEVPTTRNVGGLRIEGGGGIDFERVALIDNAWPAGQLERSAGIMRDVWVGSVASELPSRARGLIVVDASLEIDRLAARDVQGYALLAYGKDGRIDARDVTVVGSRVGECGDASCNVDGCGISIEGGHVDLSSFWVEDSDLAAICLRDGATITARSGVLARNRTGLVLENASADLDSDFEDVRLIGNVRGVVTDEPVRAGTPETGITLP